MSDVLVSTLPVGSSAKINLGSLANALAIAALCLSPPYIFVDIASILDFNPISASNTLAFLCLSFESIFLLKSGG